MTAAEAIKPSEFDGLSTVRQLGEAMQKRLQARSDLSIRKVADIASTMVDGVPLPRSTLSNVLQGKRMPTLEQLRTFLTICGEPEALLDEWEGAWDRVADERRRFGTPSSVSTAIPIGTLLDRGPKEAAVTVLRRSMPEVIEEMSKVNPTYGAKILKQWPVRWTWPWRQPKALRGVDPELHSMIVEERNSHLTNVIAPAAVAAAYGTFVWGLYRWEKRRVDKRKKADSS